MTRSPFPGMDPYLEDPAEWSTVHARLINSIGDILVEQVGPGYIVKIEQRVYILTPEDQRSQPVIPDVFVVQAPVHAASQAQASGVTQPVLVEPLFDIEVRERYIEIVDSRSRKVVTVIELLSPFNKRAGTAGRDAFLNKRRTVMASDVNWIEIDLLRMGERPPELIGKGDYYVLLKRGDRPRPYEVWFVSVRNRLPVIAVPLQPSHPDIPLDLQAALDDAYARSHYADYIDYTVPAPLPEFGPADQQWAKEQIQAWHRRG